MQLAFNHRLADGYKSPSQKARVLTEDWVYNQVYCPNCGRIDIKKHPNNKKASDFFCLYCDENYELKSKGAAIGNKVMDGEYSALVGCLQSAANPNFFLLHYQPATLCVLNFLVVPKHFFVPEMIEKRKPLSDAARRSGWTGCNILLNRVPETGKVFYVKAGKVVPKQLVTARWQKTLFLREKKDITTKGWLLDTMRCVERLGKREFSLNDLRVYEEELSLLHPYNHHVMDKIRQQLQILRDKGYIRFLGRGNYTLS